MVRILFLGLHGSYRSQMAEGLARSMATPDELEFTNVGVEAGILDSRAVEVMAELGIDISSQPSLSLSDINSTSFDLVITLTSAAAVHCPVLPGNPAVLSWEIPDPYADSGEVSLDKFRAVRDEIKRRLEYFFSGGYLSAMISLKHTSEVILDHLADGIIAHDTQRHITWFNSAAERITGYDRHEVIGNDCDQVFSGGFCGGKCPFCNDTPDFDNLNYPLKITTKDGHQKRVEMSVVAMRNESGDFQGVLASFHDITEVTQLRRQLKNVQSFHGIIGSDDKMQMIYELIGDLAVSDCPVVVQGESGTGKELIAGAIHGESRRVGRPFVTVNCGALPEGILESELFGHVRGAFTGAVRDKKGRFELADGGTIFLDEVGELSPNMQVKLLRVLQEGTFDRVGGEKPARVDVRVISATNRDLREMVRKGKFREDLYYRLCVVPVNLPPLRERRNDIPLLINHFIERAGKDIDRPIKGIAPDAMHCLIDYQWPGNIRELQNAIQYAFVKCKTEMLQTEHLPPEILSHAAQAQTTIVRSRGKLDFAQVKDALQKTNGNKVKTAQILGVGRATLYRFLREHSML
jgi:PAS domain S-box-containing protein